MLRGHAPPGGLEWARVKTQQASRGSAVQRGRALPGGLTGGMCGTARLAVGAVLCSGAVYSWWVAGY